LEGALEEIGFDGPGAAHAPIGGGHFFDHAHLDVIEGSEAIDELVKQGLEALAGFIGENDALGGEAVAQGVAGRGGLSLRGARTAGESSVGARGTRSS